MKLNMKFNILKPKKKTNSPSTSPKTQETITELVGVSNTNKDIFGRKIKSQKNVMLVEPFIITWRRKLQTRSKLTFYGIAGIAALIDLATALLSDSLIISSSLIAFSIVIFGISYYLLMLKNEYIAAISNALQIPSYNLLVQMMELDLNTGETKVSEIKNRVKYARFKKYLDLYMDSKKSDDLQECIDFTKTLPEKLKSQLESVIKKPSIRNANTLYNTNSIKAVRDNGTLAEDGQSNNVGISLANIARDGKVKRGGRAKNVQEAIQQLEEMQESQTYVKGVEFKENAPWYLKLFSAQQLDAMLEMNMTPKKMVRWQVLRIQKAAIAPIIAVIAIVVAYFLKDSVPSIKMLADPIWILAGLAMGFVVYLNQGRTITKSLKAWRFKRGLAFANFIQIVVPFLFLMKESDGSLTDVFNQVSTRMPDTNDRALIVKLQRAMRTQPNSDVPFIEFAKSFNNDPSSVVFMTTVNRSTQINGGIEVIEDLAQRNQAKLLEKVYEIRKIKESRFVLLRTYVTIIGMVINLIMVMSAMMFQTSSMM